MIVHTYAVWYGLNCVDVGLDDSISPMSTFMKVNPVV